ncbi:hypothetical protein [Salinibacillus xinjiangensis]|uniref:Lipoprotein n=1 Tax=Salinibacillus xinjiangensis TaxID=1229268 RepID=A0A6G1X5K3_9BACI|nr:hypothetical protein [Salinibacillus xinjiangensis]MRG86160.1 hypothetical protein [Salinibacillus xinjiangensis]
MKKLFLLLSIALVFVLAACGSSSDENSAEDANASEDTTEEPSENNKELKSALLKNHMEVANTVRNNYKKINDYVAALNNEEIKAEELEALKADAVEAAEKAVSNVDAYTFVKEEGLTDDAKATYEEAIGDVKGAFEAYQSALESDSTDFTTAEEKLAGYTEKVGALFEEVGLSSSADLAKELQ